LQEEDHGRARVFAQWGDTEDDIRMAIDICPVDCIYYVKRSKLALLEYVYSPA
jgi:ferredoxin